MDLIIILCNKNDDMKNKILRTLSGVNQAYSDDT